MQNDPFSNHSSPAGLVGAYKPQIDDVVHTGQLLLKRLDQPILMIWGGVLLLNLIVLVLELAVSTLIGSVVPALSIIAVPLIRLLSFVVTVVVWALVASLYGPLKRNLVGATGPERTFSELLEDIKPVFLFCLGSSAILFFAVMIGSVFCVIPGLLAFGALALAPYYSSQGTSPITAAQDSFEAARENVQIMAICTLAIVFAGLLIFGLGIGVASLLQSLGTVGAILSTIVFWLAGGVVSFAVWIVLGAVSITIDTAQTGERLSSGT